MLTGNAQEVKTLGRTTFIVQTPTKDAVTRRASQDAVLAFAWQSGEFTATEALESTGLSRSTTIDALDTLVSVGLLDELPNARAVGDYRKGRPARRFALRNDANVVAGVDAGAGHLTVIVADLRGETLTRVERTLDPEDDDIDARRAAVDDALASALAEAGHAREALVAVCAGVAAPVTVQGESPVHPTGFWRRMNPELTALLSGWAPYVRVDNDASLAAVAEGAVGSARGCRDFIALLAGARLGTGVVVDGHLLRGAHGGVGEMVAFDHVDGVGDAEGLGVHAMQWAREAVSAGETAPDGGLNAIPVDDLDGRRVLELAERGDPDAVRIADRVGHRLARIVSILGSMYDPARVIVCGAVSPSIGRVLAAARDALPTDLDLPAPEIIGSELGADVVVAGALVGALELARTHTLDLRLPEPG